MDIWSSFVFVFAILFTCIFSAVYFKCSNFNQLESLKRLENIENLLKEISEKI